MREIYKVMPLPSWIVDPETGHVYDSEGQPIHGQSKDGPQIPRPGLKAERYHSKHGRNHIGHPNCDDIVEVVTGEWKALPFKGGPEIAQLLRMQNLNASEPTHQRFAFRIQEEVDNQAELAQLMTGIPRFDATGSLKKSEDPAPAE